MDWKTVMPNSTKPVLDDIIAYLGPEVGPLFAGFTRAVHDRFSVGAGRAWSPTHGWTYSFGYSGFTFFSGVTFQEGAFCALGVKVTDAQSLQKAMEAVEAAHADGYVERLKAFQAQRSERTKQKRLERLAAQPKKEAPTDICTWPAKLTRKQLMALYDSDAKGMRDMATVDDIGYTLYTHCKEAKEIWDVMERGAIRCRGCGRELNMAAILDAGNKPYMEWCETPVACECGKLYTYRGYRQNYRRNNMPRGEASALFDRFIADWEKAANAGYETKMRLVDNLIHEAHVSSLNGTVNRGVGINLISGTKEQILDLLEALAGNRP